MGECDCLILIGERDTGVATNVPGVSMMQAVSLQVTGLLWWGQDREDGIHGLGLGGTQRMQRDRLGLGPIAEVQGGAGRAGIEVGDGDG